jgi:very-short-patch-repair endonuclease
MEQTNDSTFSPAWNTADSLIYHLLKDKRKIMRDNMTDAEVILWQHIKSKKLGVKFRRQHVIDSYIPDFVALSCKLIIEVDGESHKHQKEQDEDRTQSLIRKGYRVIRFTNNEVVNDIKSVIEKIKLELL